LQVIDWATVLLPYYCTIVTYINIKYCCTTAHAVNFRQELVLENEICGFLKVLEKSLNFNIKR